MPVFQTGCRRRSSSIISNCDNRWRRRYLLTTATLVLIQTAFQQQKPINAESCPNTTYSSLTITTPVQWSLSLPLQIILSLITSFLFLLYLLTFLLLLKHHALPRVRQSGVAFLLPIVFGMAVMAGGAGNAWWISSSTTTHILIETHACSAFQWLASFSTTLMFVPIGMKLWRIYKMMEYRIHAQNAATMKETNGKTSPPVGLGATLPTASASSSSLTPVATSPSPVVISAISMKLSNLRLLICILILILLEFCYLSIWAVVEPLKSVRYEEVLYGVTHEYQHCSANTIQGWVFLLFIATIKITLFLLLPLYICYRIMRITREQNQRVTTSHNELLPLCRFVYGACLSSVLICIIFSCFSVYGITLQLLFFLYLTFLPLSLWYHLFLPKLRYILAMIGQKDDELIEGLQGGISLITYSPAVGGGGGGVNTAADEKGSKKSSSNGTKSNNNNINNSGSGGGTFNFAAVTSMSEVHLIAYTKALESQLDRVRRRMRSLGITNNQQHHYSDASGLTRSNVLQTSQHHTHHRNFTAGTATMLTNTNTDGGGGTTGGGGGGGGNGGRRSILTNGGSRAMTAHSQHQLLQQMQQQLVSPSNSMDTMNLGNQHSQYPQNVLSPSSSHPNSMYPLQHQGSALQLHNHSSQHTPIAASNTLNSRHQPQGLFVEPQAAGGSSSSPNPAASPPFQQRSFFGITMHNVVDTSSQQTPQPYNLRSPPASTTSKKHQQPPLQRSKTVVNTPTHQRSRTAHSHSQIWIQSPGRAAAAAAAAATGNQQQQQQVLMMMQQQQQQMQQQQQQTQFGQAFAAVSEMAAGYQSQQQLLQQYQQQHGSQQQPQQQAILSPPNALSPPNSSPQLSPTSSNSNLSSASNSSSIPSVVSPLRPRRSLHHNSTATGSIGRGIGRKGKLPSFSMPYEGDLNQAMMGMAASMQGVNSTTGSVTGLGSLPAGVTSISNNTGTSISTGVGNNELPLGQGISQYAGASPSPLSSYHHTRSMSRDTGFMMAGNSSHNSSSNLNNQMLMQQHLPFATAAFLAQHQQQFAAIYAAGGLISPPNASPPNRSPTLLYQSSSGMMIPQGSPSMLALGPAAVPLGSLPSGSPPSGSPPSGSPPSNSPPLNSTFRLLSSPPQLHSTLLNGSGIAQAIHPSPIRFQSLHGAAALGAFDAIRDTASMSHRTNGGGVTPITTGTGGAGGISQYGMQPMSGDMNSLVSPSSNSNSLFSPSSMTMSVYDSISPSANVSSSSTTLTIHRGSIGGGGGGGGIGEPTPTHLGRLMSEEVSPMANAGEQQVLSAIPSPNNLSAPSTGSAIPTAQQSPGSLLSPTTAAARVSLASRPSSRAPVPSFSLDAHEAQPAQAQAQQQQQQQQQPPQSE